MAYTINLTDGTVLATVQNGTIDNTSTSLTLVGKNYAGYGEFVAENFVWMLENSSKATAPAVPLKGQLWYDSSASILKVYNGDEFKNLASAIAQESAPTENIIGDMWFDTINSQLNVYDGTTFILIGPAFSSGTGTSGSIVDTMVDTIAVEHIVVKLFVSDAVVGIVSKDTAFTPRPEDVVPGFTTIEPGIQLATTIGAASPQFTGTATNSLSLGGEIAANYLRSDINDETAGTLTIQTNTELSASGNDAIINNTNAAGLLKLQSAGADVIVIDGATDRAQVSDPLSGTDIANQQTIFNNAVYRDGSNTITGVIAPADNGLTDLGTIANSFGTVHGASTALQSATTAVDVTSNTPSAGEVLTATGPTSAIWKTIIDVVYPVGAIYTSVANTSPATLFGGTWSSIQGRTLMAEGGTPGYVAGSTGGNHDAEAIGHTHADTFAVAAVGNHVHNVKLEGHTGSMGADSFPVGSDGGGIWIGIDDPSATRFASGNTDAGGSHSHTLNGSVTALTNSGADKNMPPYLAVYMWQRTA